MKKGRIAFSHIIAAVLILILIVTVIFVFVPVFDDIKEKLGFGVTLTAGEIKVQSESKELFEQNISLMLLDCISSNEDECFCMDDEIIFPNSYSLEIYLQNEVLTIGLYNHLGGLVSDKVLTGLDSFGVVFSDGVFLDINNLEFLKIEYSPDSQVVSNLDSDLLDLSSIFYKLKDNRLAIVSREIARQLTDAGKEVCN